MRPRIIGLVFMILLVVGADSSWSQTCPAATCEEQCGCDHAACSAGCADSPTPFFCRRDCNDEFQWCSMLNCPAGGGGGGTYGSCCLWHTSCYTNSRGEYECTPTYCAQWGC